MHTLQAVQLRLSIVRLSKIRILSSAALLITTAGFASRALADPTAPVAVVASSDTAAATPVAAETKHPWYDDFKARAFVDAYYAINYNFAKPDKSSDVIRAFDVNNGFALSWFGVDVSHAAEPIGGTVSLRFGPTATRFALNDAGTGYGLEFVKQAFVSWSPLKKLTLDFGKFATPYGAEVAESQDNFTYTRGIVNWGAQPFFHTGLRATYQISDHFSGAVLAVNGWDRTLDNNIMKTFGAQVAYNSDLVSVALGYMAGPEQDDTGKRGDIAGANGRFRHFVDLVTTVRPTARFTAWLNGDIGTEEVLAGSTETASSATPVRWVSWYAASIAAQQKLWDRFAVAGRAEYFADPDGARLGVPNQTIVTGTVTLDFAPVKYLLLRLENRLDWADKPIFLHGSDQTAEPRHTEVTSTLGVVVQTS